ncbi:MAG: hypothetical protein KatS3mg082_2219 [Nitrospiraceae bacterium]|nr:MAG: hypothetical protein KatS3mg082_2219 [Nitrospiraceae bacterium]
MTAVRPQTLKAFLRRLSPNRSVRLTGEGTRFVLFTLAVGIAAVNTGNNLFYLLLAMMLSLIVISGLLSEQCLRRLEFRRRVPDYLIAGRPAAAALSVLNRKPWLPSFSLRIADVVDGITVERGIHVPHLGPRSSVLLSYPLLITRRGLHRLEGVRVTTPFPFGLFLKSAFVPLETTVIVCPEIKPVPDGLVRELIAEGHKLAISRRGQGVDLYNLRLYRPGDDSRAIHWMTTARTSRLIVRETEAEDQRHVTLALSTVAPQGQQESFEQAVILTASLAVFFHDRGFTLRALVGDREIPPASGESQLYSILHALALCEMAEPTASEPVRETFRRTLASGDLADSSIAILPWPDPEIIHACRHVTRRVDMTEYQDAVYETRPGIPT